MLKDLKFKESDFANNDVASLPNKPSEDGYTADMLKKRFDNVGKNLIAMDRFNKLLDELSTIDYTSNITATNLEDGVSVSNVQAELKKLYDKINSIYNGNVADNSISVEKLEPFIRNYIIENFVAGDRVIYETKLSGISLSTTYDNISSLMINNSGEVKVAIELPNIAGISVQLKVGTSSSSVWTSSLNNKIYESTIAVSENTPLDIYMKSNSAISNNSIKIQIKIGNTMLNTYVV